MHEHIANLRWERGDADFDYKSYPRAHTWSFDGGVEVAASAAPAFLGSAERVDPEEAFVASIASCHLLTFLAIASRQRLTVDAYADRAVGVLEENDEGRLAVTRVDLHPEIRFAPGQQPDPAALGRLHERAHRECFIANSVRTRIRVILG